MGGDVEPGLIARRLEWLFENIRKADGSTYSQREVARKLEQLGYPITSTTIWKVRQGITRSPGADTLKALAVFFKVNPAIFFEEVDDDAALVKYLEVDKPGDPLVQQIAFRAAQLQPDSQKALLTIMEQMVREKLRARDTERDAES